MTESDILEKHKAKARLLKKLADNGIDGEKENAERKLKEHLEKHNISIEDIDEKLNNRIFKINNDDERMIFTNVILSVNPFTKLEQNTKFIAVNLDLEDYTEVKQKLKYFIKLWREEKEILTMAFFHKHKEYFQPDEFTKNKWRDKKKMNEDLQKATEKAEKLNTKLSSKDEDELNKSMANQLLKIKRMCDMATSLKEAKYNRRNKTISLNEKQDEK